MKCRSCYRFVLDDAKFCEHCGTGLSTTGPKIPHPHDGHQHHHHHQHDKREDSSPRPPTSEAGKAALAKIRALLSKPKVRNNDWAREIVERHDKGERVAPHALQSAREALGQSKDQQELRAVEAELKARGPIRVPGEDDERQANPIGQGTS